ncbi:hypothetical protein ALPO108162_11555 [Alicyclobacillus pomorum]
MPIPPACEALLPHLLANLGQFISQQFLHEGEGHLAAVVEYAVRMADPLPHLRARDFCRCGVLHEIENRYRAYAAQPGLNVLNRDADVVAQAMLADAPFWHLKQVRRRDVNVFALAVDLVWRRHVLVERLHRHRDQRGVRDPRAIVPIRGFPNFIHAYLFQRFLVGDGIVLDRNLSGHAANGVRVSLVARLNGQQRIRPHARRRHRHKRPVR